MVFQCYKEQNLNDYERMFWLIILFGDLKDKGQRLYVCTWIRNMHLNPYLDLDVIFI